MVDRDVYPEWLDPDDRSRTVTRDPELVAEVADAWQSDFDGESDFYTELLLLTNELQQRDLMPLDLLSDLKTALEGGQITVEIQTSDD